MKRLVPVALAIAAIMAVLISGFTEWMGLQAFGASTVPTKIIIKVPAHRLYLYRDGKLFRSYPVAVGKPGTKSPRGEFFITQKAIWGDGFGTRWMRISVPWGIYGIHGTNKPWTVGTVASHGCFRMYNRDVEELYSLVAVHTPVIIEGPTPYAKIARPLTREAIGQDVVELERLLRLAKVYAGPLSGVYTADVAAAVQKFQTVVGLDPSGTATLPTVAKLQEFTAQQNLKPRYLDQPGGHSSGSGQASRPPHKAEHEG